MCSAMSREVVPWSFGVQEKMSWHSRNVLNFLEDFRREIFAYFDLSFGWESLMLCNSDSPRGWKFIDDSVSLLSLFSIDECSVSIFEAMKHLRPMCLPPIIV